jgi:uncharacterized membrane protein YfcA
MIDFWMLVLLAIVAMLYASVGHGGASGYIAVLTLFSFTPDVIRPLVLLLNTGVSILAFQRYYRAGYFRWTLFWPFILTSVPGAYLGGTIKIETHIFHAVLGFLLIFPVLNLLGLFKEKEVKKELQLVPALLIGAVIGFLSGLIGIGGGILLSPLLLLLGWSGIKEAAAVSALFIFVNSIVVLLALDQPLSVFTRDLIPVPFVVLIAGLLGGHLGALKLHQHVLKRILALVLMIAVVKLIFV